MKKYSLHELQSWFGEAIRTPLRFDHRLKKCSDADSFIAPSLTLTSHERLEIYHQQYWWRLLKILREQFPFLCRLFGLSAFHQEIAVPFLIDFPPCSWSLASLGKNLPNWLQKNYKMHDRHLILRAAEIDGAVIKSFHATRKKKPEISLDKPEFFLAKKIGLQPHVFLFQLQADFFSCREKMVNKTIEYWERHSFPELKKGLYHFLLYRSLENEIKWCKLAPLAYRVLSSFQRGVSLRASMAELEKEDTEEIATKIPLWFREWGYLNLFCEA